MAMCFLSESRVVLRFNICRMWNGHWVLIFCLVACWSCKQETVQEKTPSVVDMLEAISEDSSFIHNNYLNAARAEYYLELLNENKHHDAYLEAAQELLNAGKSKEAIDLIAKLLKELKNFQVDEDEKLNQKIQQLLSVSFLRQGEQENCIHHHNGESCIIPLSGGGIYTITEATESAINEYIKILDQYPDHLLSKWLLNIAYMALGHYPDSVPQPYLINTLAIKSDYDIKKFNNIGIDLPIGSTGLAGGCCVEDFDNDGFLDVIVSSMDLKDNLQFFRNDGKGSFDNITVAAGLQGQLGGLNIIHADYDNDGYADLLVLRGGWFRKGTGEHPNSLLRNNGDNTFTDVTIEAGLLSFCPTQTAVWSDFNNDGWLDLFIGNETWAGDSTTYPNQLYLNQKDGTFVDITEKAGIDALGYVKGVTAGDYNNDNLPDLYISRFGELNVLYRNDGPDENGICTFTDVTESAGVGDPIFSFPVWFWDYNNDGWEDLFVSTYDYNGAPDEIIREYLDLTIKPSSYSCLYKNNGDGTFTNVSEKVGLNKVLFTMGCNFGDLDNDGFLDFFVGTGAPDLRYVFPNRMFRNDGGIAFLEVTESGGFGHLQKGHGIAFCDIDNDGDQDVYAVMGGAYTGDFFQNALFQNPGHGNNWITIKLVGTKSNKMAVGTKVKVVLNSNDEIREIYRTVSTGGSFGSTSLQLEIGLGQAAEINELLIDWPASGVRQSFKGIKANQFIRIKEDSNQIIFEERETIIFQKTL